MRGNANFRKIRNAASYLRLGLMTSLGLKTTQVLVVVALNRSSLIHAMEILSIIRDCIDKCLACHFCDVMCMYDKQYHNYGSLSLKK